MQKTGILTDLTVNGSRVPVGVTSSPRRRTVCVQVYPDGSVLVRIPAGFPLSKVRRFFEAKRQWAVSKVEAACRAQAERPSRTFEDGERIPVLGRDLVLRLRAAKGKRGGCEVLEDSLFLSLPRCEPTRRKAEADRLLAQWYMDRAKRIFPQRIEALAPGVGERPERLSYRRNRSRWGSCNAGTKSLTFNWQLVMAPPEILDYVVLHELCHLRVPNHSPAFWTLVEGNMPDFRQRRRHLRNFGWRYVL